MDGWKMPEKNLLDDGIEILKELLSGLVEGLRKIASMLGF
jgi:hypothetical protein